MPDQVTVVTLASHVALQLLFAIKYSDVGRQIRFPGVKRGLTAIHVFPGQHSQLIVDQSKLGKSKMGDRHAQQLAH